MPELPEVETTKEGIKKFITGCRIESIVVRNPKLRIPVNTDIDTLCKNKTIEQVRRRAKYLLLQLSQGHILIHLGMSGHLRVVPYKTPPEKHDHVDLICDNKQILRFRDPRRFGIFHYFDEEPDQCALLTQLGPEPLEEQFNANYLYLKSRNKSQPIKSFIMNNTVVVGIGNIYAAESLFLAGIHPLQKANTLSQKQCTDLTKAIKLILNKAIQVGGTTLKDYYSFDGKPGYFNMSLQAYARQNKPCLKCSTLIQSLYISGRQSAFCPSCQSLKI